MESVIFQNCTSHCNGYSKKNRNVDLKVWKIQQNLECVTTDITFKHTDFWKHKLVLLCCFDRSVLLTWCRNEPFFLHNYFIYIYSHILFFSLWKEKQIYSIHCEKFQKLQVPHTMHTRVFILVCGKLFNNRVLGNMRDSVLSVWSKFIAVAKG